MKRRLALLFVGLFAYPIACGTSPIGVEDCREIETARCKASVQCGTIDEGDEAACETFFRDHCLHGMQSEDPPEPVALQDCVQTIAAAGACEARKHNTKVGSCRGAASDFAKRYHITESFKDQNVCSIVLQPDVAPQCSFLLLVAPPKEEAKDEDAGKKKSSKTEEDAGSD